MDICERPSIEGRPPFPPSARVQRRLQGPPAKSNFLAVKGIDRSQNEEPRYKAKKRGIRAIEKDLIKISSTTLKGEGSKIR
jgi:hypothetical protein